MMKSKFKFKLALFFLSLVLVYSCEEDKINIPLQSIEINNSDFLISVDEVKQLVVKASPSNATQNVTWETSNRDVAVIQYNTSGLVAGVKGVSLGSATLTAKSQDGALMKTINAQVIVKVEKIELIEEPINDPAKTKYNVVFTPSDATFQTVTWSSSDENVISVSNSGEITAISPGAALITATSTKGAKKASVQLNASGNPVKIGLDLEYCSITGTGKYNVETVKTSGADANLDYSGSQPPAVDNNYEFYTAQTLEVTIGNSFTLDLTQSNRWSKSKVWIDWNGDSDFDDAGELVIEFGVDKDYNDGPFSKSVTVPSSAIKGNTRMRIQTLDAWSDFGLCGNVINQTTKDFKVSIL